MHIAQWSLTRKAGTMNSRWIYIFGLCITLNRVVISNGVEAGSHQMTELTTEAPSGTASEDSSMHGGTHHQPKPLHPPPDHNMNSTSNMPSMNHDPQGNQEPVGPPSHGNMDHGVGMTNGSHNQSKSGQGHGQGHGGTSSAGGHYGYFHFTSTTVLLFQEWKTTTWKEIIGACFVFGIAAFLYEGLKSLRQFLERKAHNTSAFITVKPTFWQSLCNWIHFLQTFLHVVQVVYAYMLMLAFMTFNVWICVAIALGSGLGYFFLCVKHERVVDSNDHCL